MDDGTIRLLRHLVRREVRRETDAGHSAPAPLNWRTPALALSSCLIGIILGRYVWPGVNPATSENLSDGIGIPAFVDRVREELMDSDRKREQEGKPPLLKSRSVDLEFSFVAKKTTGVGSKVALQVIDVDAKRDISSEKTQKMVLHLDVSQPESLEIPPSTNTTPTTSPGPGRF